MHDRLGNAASSSVKSADVDLVQRLEEIRGRHPAVDPPAVAEIVRAVLATMQGDLTAQETSLLAEVEELGRTIAVARAEIAALEVIDITESHIPTATDELDAVVDHTAMATDRILETCETLDALAARVAPDDAETLRVATTQIYEACSFQDITGQRISKVTAALKAIDRKIAHIVATFGARQRGAGMLPSVLPVLTEEPDPALLHGPQLPTAAMAQVEIDRLLASFE